MGVAPAYGPCPRTCMMTPKSLASLRASSAMPTPSLMTAGLDSSCASQRGSCLQPRTLIRAQALPVLSCSRAILLHAAGGRGFQAWRMGYITLIMMQPS